MSLPQPLTYEYFGHPLTDAKFDRTPEQRRRHGELVGQLSVGRVGPLIHDLGTMANRRMFLEFVEDVDALVVERTKGYIGDRINVGPSADGQVCQMLAGLAVMEELAELDAVLPHPSIDRLAQSAGADA